MRHLLALLLLAGSVAAEDDWLATNAVPFEAVEAGHGFEDLRFLEEWIGDARIVSLGESTHGSKEIFQMKHRLLEFLATEMGFAIFSIEASFPESFAVNDFVEHGEGDPAKLIAGMYFWTWNTEEVRAMVEWMRAFNAAGKGPVRFTGFDMQTPDVAARIATEFAKDDSYITERYEKILESSRPFDRGFAAVGGSLPVESLRGKTVRVSGKIRTERAGWAAFWLRADAGSGSFGLDNMRARAPRGTSDWQDYHVELAVPASAQNVVFGALLHGDGEAYFDAMRITVDGESWRPAGIDLDFEGDRLEASWTVFGAYRASLVTPEVPSGEQCLKLERVAAAGPVGVDPRAVVPLAEEALERLAAHKDRPGYAWAEQNARVVLQYTQQRADLVPRDKSMADNVQWILRQNPEAKIVLWAHNGHVARKPGWMGHHLDAVYGDKHVPVGFATAKGTYRAMKPGAGLATNPLEEPPEGSWEARLGKLGKPLLAVDLRGAPAELREPIPMRSVGALATNRQFYPHEAPKWFDILIYIEETSAAVGLKR